MTFLGSRTYWLILVGLLFLVAISGTVGFLHRPYKGPITQLTNKYISAMQLKDYVTNESVNIPGKHKLLLFYYNAASLQNLQNITYAAQLINKYHPPDIDILVITGMHFSELETMRRSGFLPFPLVVDSSFAVARELTVPTDSDRSFVVDTDGRLLFAPKYEAFHPEDIRELYERFTKGQITYSIGPPIAANAIGKSFPNLRVKEVHGNKQLMLFDVAKPVDTSYLVFTAACPACTLDTILRRMKTNIENQNVVAIITSRVPEVELLQVIERADVSKPIYLALDEMADLEDVYYDFGASEGSVLLIKTDHYGKIIAVEPLA